MKKLLFLLSLATLFIVGGCTKSTSVGNLPDFENADAMVEAASVNLESVTVAEFRRMYEEFEPYVLIDVRSEGEFAAGFVPGAVNIPRGSLEFRIANEAIWDKEGLYAPLEEDLIIVMCKVGSRSVLAAQTLNQLGYTNIKYLMGGFTEWSIVYPDMIEKLIVEGDAAAGMTSSPAGGGGC